MPTVAFRTVRKRRKFIKYPKVKRGLAVVLDDTVKPHFLDAFKRVVANWKTQIQFKARKFIRPDRIWLDVFPAGANKKIWEYVSGGTSAHTISAKGGGRLAFLWGGKGSYKAKTKPPGKFGGPGTVSGGTMHFPQTVNHPGSAAREFEKTIMEDNKAWFSRTMENAWRRIIRSL